MEYRTTDPEDDEFDDEEVFDALQEQAHEMMYHCDADNIVDTLLMLSNVCDTRKILRGADRRSAEWYGKLSSGLRELLEKLTADDYALPDVKIEDPLLYFPDPGGNMH